MGTRSYLNTAGHPLDFDNGYVVGAGEHVEIEETGDLLKHYVGTGQLTPQAEPTKAAKAQVQRGRRQEREGVLDEAAQPPKAEGAES